MIALYTDHGTKLTVTRANVVGQWAAVLLAGGYMEGSPVTEPILVEHFSFGWQALDILNVRSRLDAHRLASSTRTSLMRGMPKMTNDSPCRGACNDSGPQRDVDAVRIQIRGPLVPAVIVSGDYALGQWYGGGGGETLFKKYGRVWRQLTHGGGAMGTLEMKEYHVPRSAWCPFGLFDAACKPAGENGAAKSPPTPQ